MAIPYETIFNFATNIAGGRAAQQTSKANLAEAARKRQADAAAIETGLNAPTGETPDTTVARDETGGYDVAFKGAPKRLQEIDLQSANRIGDLLGNMDFNIDDKEARGIVSREQTLQQGLFDEAQDKEAMQFNRANRDSNPAITRARGDAAALFAMQNRLPGPRDAAELGINLSNARIGNLQQAIAANQRLAPPDPGGPGKAVAQLPVQLPPADAPADLGGVIPAAVIRDVTGFQQALAGDERRKRDLQLALRTLAEQGSFG